MTLAQAQWTYPLTGWAATGDAIAKLKLNFDTVEQAIQYAKSQNLNYEVCGDNSKREATLAKRNKVQIYDHNFLGPDMTNYLKKHGPVESTKVWEFEQQGKSFWTNPERTDFGPDKYSKAKTPVF